MTDPGTILITGASRGIGRAVAIELAKHGWDLVLWARDVEALREVADECAGLGVTVGIEQVDVSIATRVDEEGAKSLAHLSGLRGLIINAGIGIWGQIDRLEPNDWVSVLDTNLGGAFSTLQVALPKLLRVPGAQIISMSSDSSQHGFAERGAYCASKWGLHGLIESLRAEVRPQGVRVTQIMPSRVDTYFRGKTPGSRPESLRSLEVAQVIGWLFTLPTRVEIRTLEVSAMTTTFGPYTEVSTCP